MMQTTPDVERDRFTETLQRLTTEIERLERLYEQRHRRRTTLRPTEQEYHELVAAPHPHG